MAKYITVYNFSVDTSVSVNTNSDNNDFVVVETKSGKWDGTWEQAMSDINQIAKVIGLPSQYVPQLRDALEVAKHRAQNDPDFIDPDLGLSGSIETIVVNPNQLTLLRDKIKKAKQNG